ncbi:MAG: alpha/beta fold hydrolase [Myxococcaceae bacterium]
MHFLDEGRGPAVVLLHAYPLNSTMFRPQLDALKSRFRILAPDLRGFGKSEASGSNAVEMSTYADDVRELLDQLRIDSAVIGGVSMGGYIAQALLRQDAGRVAGLVLMDTQALADDDAGKAKREQNAQAALSGGMNAVADAMVPNLVAPHASAELKAEVRAMILGNRAEAAAAAQRGMARRIDSKDMLVRYAGPALVIVGEEDVLTPPAKAKQIADLLKDSELAVIPRAGHLANLEAPQAVNAILLRFLERLRI